MRCDISIVILFYMSILSFNTLESGDALPNVRKKRGKDTSLQIIVSNIASLLRITNAIYLENEANVSDGLLKNVAIELLRTKEEVLQKISGLDPKIVTIMNKSVSIIKANMNFSLQINDSERETFNYYTERLNLSLHYFNAFNNVRNKSIDLFASKISNPNFTRIYSPCNSETISRAAAFHKVLGNSTIDKIDKLSKSSDSLMECFQILKKYKNNAQQILTLYKNIFRKINYIFDDVSPNYSLSKENVTGLINYVWKKVNSTKGIWSKLNASKVEFFMKTLSEASTRYLKDISSLKLTAGFQEKGDIARVSSDLKSDWFKKNATTEEKAEELSKYLSGFIKFGEYMKKLEESWTNSTAEYKRRVVSHRILDKLFKAIVKVEKGKPFESILNASNHSVSACWNDSNNAVFSQNKKELSQITSLINNISSIKMIAEEIITSVDHLQVNDTLQKALKDRNERVAYKLGSDYVIANFGNHFYKLNKSKSNLEENIKEINRNSNNLTTIIYGIINKIKEGNHYKRFVCLKKEGFDVEFLNLMISFFGDLSQWPKNVEDDIPIWSSGLLKIKRNLEELEQFLSKTKVRANGDNSVLKLANGSDIIHNVGNALMTLKDMTKAHLAKDSLTASLSFSPETRMRIISYNPHPQVKEFWKNADHSIKSMITNLDRLNNDSEHLRGQGIVNVALIFSKALYVHGIQEAFNGIYSQLKIPNITNEAVIAKTLNDLNFNFDPSKAVLKFGHAQLRDLQSYFNPKEKDGNSELTLMRALYLIPSLVCFGLFGTIIIAFIVAYGYTKNGREKYKKIYIYYFGKKSHFEKRWRYSLFLDRQNGKNALLEAAREINPTNVRKAVKKGAYIDVYNKQGDTALHVATKRGYYEIVEILIKNGADRNLLNAQNKTAEQLISPSSKFLLVTHLQDKNRLEKTGKVFEKYKKRKFRVRVPDTFSPNSFHIYSEDRTNDEITNRFMERFIHIGSTEAGSNITHCIMKTDPNGYLETDNLDLLAWIFIGVIIVKDTWMIACLNNEKTLLEDYNYLVEKVKYKGVLYDTIIPWSTAMAKGTMPYLYGVYVAIVVPEYPKLFSMALIVRAQGGVMCDKFPEKQYYNKGSHPYLHSSLGPLFIIHDGNQDLDEYKNDPDKMYTLFTEEEFVHFMLARNICRDTSVDPIPVANETISFPL